MALSTRALAQTAAERIAPLRVLDDSPSTLLVHEIYSSVQGEGTRAGRPCTFVRLTGCHLRCVYCDTEHAFDQGTARSVDDVHRAVGDAGLPLVQVTGGEPLLQPAVHELMRRLADDGYEVVLETSGAVSTQRVDERVIVVLDVKTPGSGESARHLDKTLSALRSHDEVKFVICNDEDYEFARELVEREALHERCTVLFAPEDEAMDKRALAERIVVDRLPVRFMVQLHKVLWGQRSGV